jgi:hypothetical protein
MVRRGISTAYEPGGREFESLRARQIIQILRRAAMPLLDVLPGSDGQKPHDTNVK